MEKRSPVAEAAEWRLLDEHKTDWDKIDSYKDYGETELWLTMVRIDQSLTHCCGKRWVMRRSEALVLCDPSSTIGRPNLAVV